MRTARGDRIRREQKKADECGHMKQNEAARARLSAAAVAASIGAAASDRLYNGRGSSTKETMNEGDDARK